MATYNAGRVSPVPQGAYSASTEYERLDMVSYNGGAYMYINVTPTTGTAVTNETYWMSTGGKGDKGDTGDTGATGAQGTAGTDGDSGYQVAVDNGYTGTEVEWLASLKGDKGDKGDTGDTGATGATGEQGIQGDKGDAGDSAYEIAVDEGYSGTEAEWLASITSINVIDGGTASTVFSTLNNIDGGGA